MDLKNGLPVAIQLRTEIFQQGEKNEHYFDVVGQLVQLGDTLYLRYQEPQVDGEALPVTIKIEADGTVQLIRASQKRMRLKFSYQQSHYASYQTPYGLFQIRTFTNNLRISLKDQPISGKVALDYELYAGEEKLGVYHLHLQFTA